MNTLRTVRVGIVGGGLGALMAYTILRFRGLKRHEIAIFSSDASPEQSWEKLARAINLTSLRSESTGHFFPTDSPGLATLAVFKTWSLRPIIQAWFDRFHPTVDAFIEHTKSIARQTGFYAAIVPTKIGNVTRAGEVLTLWNEFEKPVAYAQHVIIAVGHGQERVPEAIANFRKEHPGDEPVKLSYEPKPYHAKTYLVLGDGITAATEWENILKAGGAVAAVSLHGFDLGQPLQVPRRYFSKRGLHSYAKKPSDKRLQELRAATRGTIPHHPAWKKLFAQAERAGRLGYAQAELKAIRLQGNQLACDLMTTQTGQQHTIVVDHVISATGFLPPVTHPLLSRLIKEYNLPTYDNLLLLDHDCCLEKLSTPHSVISVIGQAAAWTIPCADSLGGLKIAARRLANVIVGPESLAPRQLAAQTKRWFRLVTGKILV